MPPATQTPAAAPPPVPPRTALCIDCNYPLRDLVAGRCPECGRAFDPRVLATMNLGAPVGPVARVVLRPIGLPMFTAAMMPLALLLWVAISPQLYYLLAQYFLSAFALVAVGGMHGGWLLGKWYTRTRLGQPPSVMGNDLRRWRAVWFVAACTVLLVVFKVPMRLGFAGSSRGLTKLVEEARANPNVPIVPGRRAGIYTVVRVDLWDDGRTVMIRTTPSCEGGFAYSPRGEDHLSYNQGDAGALWGGWYWFSED